MIGTIKPASSHLKCAGIQQEVKNGMCRTCAALGQKGILARPFLSHDAIFLSLFSQEELFVRSRLRYRPFQCCISNRKAGLDGNYLANISVVTATVKIEDDRQDEKPRLAGGLYQHITKSNDEALQDLEQSGFPVLQVQDALSRYTKIELLQNAARPFSEIAKPIADAYGLVFGNLPSRLSDQQMMTEIGQHFGELTLLVDAVNDVEEDSQTGNFNAWQASNDISKDLAAVKLRVADIFEVLREKSSRLSAVAGSYIKSAEESVTAKLGLPKRQRNHLSALLAAPPVLFAEACMEQDCEGNSHVTTTGWMVFGGLLFCCCFFANKKIC